MQYLAAYSLLNKLRRRHPQDRRSDPVSVQRLEQLRALKRAAVWEYLLDLWEAEYNHELRLLMKEKDRDKACRRQGRLEAYEKIVGTPYRLTENLEDEE